MNYWGNTCMICGHATSSTICLTCEQHNKEVTHELHLNFHKQFITEFPGLVQPVRPQLSRFQTERIKFLISQADKGTAVYLGKGDSEIFKKLLEIVDKEE